MDVVFSISISRDFSKTSRMEENSSCGLALLRVGSASMMLGRLG